MQGTGLNQHGCNRATSLVQTGFNDKTFCHCFDRCGQFQNFSLQQDVFQQGIDTLSGFCRNRNKRNVATVFFRNDVFCNEFLRNAIDVGSLFINLVDCHNDRNASRFRMRNRFLRLRHDAIVSSDNQNNDIGRFRTTGTHSSKSFMARSIEESHNTATGFDVIRTDMLGNATRFAGSDLGTANIVKKRRLAVVDVTHNGNDRSARQQFSVFIVTHLGQFRFNVLNLGSESLVSHFLDQNHGRFLIQHLIDRDHLAQFHQLLDHFGSLDSHLVRQFGDGNGFRNVNVMNNRFCRLMEIAFPFGNLRVATSFRATRTTTPATIASGHIVTTAFKACTPFFRTFFLPCRSCFGRFLVGRRFLFRFLVGSRRSLFLGRFVLCRSGLCRFGNRSGIFLGRRRASCGCGSRFFRLFHHFTGSRSTHHRLDLGDLVFHCLAGTFRFLSPANAFSFRFCSRFFSLCRFFSHPSHFCLLQSFGRFFFFCSQLLFSHFLPFSILAHFFSRLTLLGFFLFQLFGFDPGLFFGLDPFLLLGFHLSQ